MRGDSNINLGYRSADSVALLTGLIERQHTIPFRLCFFKNLALLIRGIIFNANLAILRFHSRLGHIRLAFAGIISAVISLCDCDSVHLIRETFRFGDIFQ